VLVQNLDPQMTEQADSLAERLVRDPSIITQDAEDFTVNTIKGCWFHCHSGKYARKLSAFAAPVA